MIAVIMCPVVRLQYFKTFNNIARLMPTSRQYFKGHRSKGVACMQLFESVMTKYYL